MQWAFLDFFFPFCPPPHEILIPWIYWLSVYTLYYAFASYIKSVRYFSLRNRNCHLVLIWFPLRKYASYCTGCNCLHLSQVHSPVPWPLTPKIPNQNQKNFLGNSHIVLADFGVYSSGRGLGDNMGDYTPAMQVFFVSPVVSVLGDTECCGNAELSWCTTIDVLPFLLFFKFMKYIFSV